MTHPYIDCARRLAAKGIKADDIKEIVCEVGEGTVHRLWEPLAAKQRPPNGYAGEVLDALLHRGRLRARQCRARRLHRRRGARAGACSRSPPRCATRSIRNNPYPNNFTGHIRAVLRRRPRGRGAPAAHARRRARAADARATSRRSSCSMPRTAVGTSARAQQALARCCGRFMTAGSTCRRCAGRAFRGTDNDQAAGRPRRIVTGCGPQYRPRDRARAGGRTAPRSSSMRARTSSEADGVVREIEAGRRQGARGHRRRRRRRGGAEDGGRDGEAVRPHRYSRQQRGAAPREAARSDELRGMARGHRRWCSTAPSIA